MNKDFDKWWDGDDLTYKDNPFTDDTPAYWAWEGWCAGVNAERKAMMQLFTDPENQPTQHGTVTLKYMQREIAAEREACAQFLESTQLGSLPEDTALHYARLLKGFAEGIRVRTNNEH